MSRLSCGCVTEWNCLPSNMSHVLARVRDVLIEFTVNTNLPFRTTKSFQLLKIWTNPKIREAAFRSLTNSSRQSTLTEIVHRECEPRSSPASNHSCSLIKFAITSLEVQEIANNSQTVRTHSPSVSEKPTERRSMLGVNEPH